MANFQKFHISVKALLKVGNEFLVLKVDSNLPSPDCLDFPGGRVDEEEMLKDVLQRELKEEIGITEKVLELNVVGTSQRYSYPLFKTEGCCLCEIINLVELSEKPEIKLSNEHSAFNWINKNTNLEDFKYKDEAQKKLIANFKKKFC